MNEHDSNEAHEDGLTPRCGYCGSPMIGQRADSQYCTRTCKQKARAKRRRRDARVDSYRTAYPDAAEAWDGPPDDDIDQEHQDQDGNEADNGWPDLWHRHEADNEPGTFGHLLRLHEAEQDIRAQYERRMEPYRAQLRRNHGVRPSGLVAIERERDRELAGLANTGDVLTNTSRATEPRRINEARERHSERTALQALGNALPGNRSGHVSYRGRDTHDVWAW